jgi:hypothetical protein
MKTKRHRKRAPNDPTPKWCEAQSNWMVSDYRSGKRKRMRFQTLEKATAHCEIVRSHYRNAQKVSQSGFAINPALAISWAFLDEQLRSHYATDLVRIAQDYISSQDAANSTTARGRHLLQMIAAHSTLTFQK